MAANRDVAAFVGYRNRTLVAVTTADPTPATRLTTLVALALLLLAATLLTAALWPQGAQPDGPLLTWGPAAALGTALLAVSPRAWWPALTALVVAAPAVCVVLLPVADPLLPLLLALGCAVEVVLAAWLLRRGRTAAEVVLVDTAGYFRMLLAVSCGAVAMTLVAALAAVAAGVEVASVVRAVLPAHLGAGLVVLPIVLVPAVALRGRLLGEALLQTGLLALLLLVPLWLPGSLAVLMLPLPALLWAALRLPPLVAATQVGAVALVTATTAALGTGGVYGTSRALGGSVPLALTDVQVALVCLGLLVVPAALASEQRRTLLAGLEAERELSTSILDRTNALIILADGDGTIRHANAALQRLTGFELEELAGLRFHDSPLLPPERQDLVRAMFAGGAAEGLPPLREAEIMTTSGDRVRVVWSNNVVRNAGGQVTVVCTATDVTAERTSRRLIQQLFGSPGSAPMISMDSDYVVTLVNPAAASLLGLPPEAVVGEPVTRIVCPHDVSDLLLALDEATTNTASSGVGTPVRHSWSWRRPDDREVRVSASVSVVPGTGKDSSQFLLVLGDVTADREQQEALLRALEAERQAVRQLTRLDAVRNDLVSTVSHELRTPTTSIVGYTEMLRDGQAGELQPEQQQMLDVIARNGRRLISVSEDLLTLAGLETVDRGPWPQEQVDLRRVVGQALSAMSPLAGDRSQQVESDLPADPVLVEGDPALLDRALVNLLSNAIKFTPEHGRVSCRLSCEDGHADLEVSDTGIGIPEEEQDELFTKFFRSSTAQELAIPGTGLGLAIVHRIVSEHHGTIAVRSTPGAGTTFAVRLPLLAGPAGRLSRG